MIFQAGQCESSVAGRGQRGGGATTEGGRAEEEEGGEEEESVLLQVSGGLGELELLGWVIGGRRGGEAMKLGLHLEKH